MKRFGIGVVVFVIGCSSEHDGVEFVPDEYSIDIGTGGSASGRLDVAPDLVDNLDAILASCSSASGSVFFNESVELVVDRTVPTVPNDETQFPLIVRARPGAQTGSYRGQCDHSNVVHVNIAWHVFDASPPDARPDAASVDAAPADAAPALDQLSCHCIGAPPGAYAIECRDVADCGPTTPLTECASLCANGADSVGCQPEAPACAPLVDASMADAATP